MKAWKQKKLKGSKEKRWNVYLGEWNEKVDNDGKISQIGQFKCCNLGDGKKCFKKL